MYVSLKVGSLLRLLAIVAVLAAIAGAIIAHPGSPREPGTIAPAPTTTVSVPNLAHAPENAPG